MQFVQLTGHLVGAGDRFELAALLDQENSGGVDTRDQLHRSGGDFGQDFLWLAGCGQHAGQFGHAHGQIVIRRR